MRCDRVGQGIDGEGIRSFSYIASHRFASRCVRLCYAMRGYTFAFDGLRCALLRSAVLRYASRKQKNKM
jgi:hypothetical protein